MHNYSNLPPAEYKHLQQLRRLKVLASPYESLFNTITLATSEICKTSIALISFVEEDRIWFKTKTGLDGIEVSPIELAFCAQTILSDEIMEVRDATLDDRFKDNPLVTGYPKIRFYAGAPITFPLGERIGSLCVMDSNPSQLNEYQKAALEGFAKVITQALLISDMHSRNSQHLTQA